MLSKVSLPYGATCGVLLLVLFYASALLGINPFINIIHLLFDAIILAVCIATASFDYKKRSGGGFHFWEGMTIGFIVYGVGVTLFLVGLALYLFFEPEIVINYKEEATNFLLARKEVYLEQFGESGLKAQKEAIESTTPFGLVKSMGLKKLLTGLLITPAIAIIFRKKQTTT